MGRHREFDVEKTLDAALHVFWTKGYEGASYDDLSDATGVARPGLYKAFGNKEAFFLRAVDLYEEKFAAYVGQALEQPAINEVVRRFLEGAVDAQTAFSERRGCMIINGAMTCSDENKPVRDDLIERRRAAEAVVRNRLERARDEGELSASTNCQMLASYLMTMAHGIAVQAKAGAAKTTLKAVVEHVMSTWPGS